MSFIGVAGIIAVIVISVRFVYERSYEMGRKAGVIEGQKETIEQNVKRVSIAVKLVNEYDGAILDLSNQT